jgi:hypothetical protein
MRFVVVDLIYDEEFLDARQRAFASVSGDEVPTAKFGVSERLALMVNWVSTVGPAITTMRFIFATT